MNSSTGRRAPFFEVQIVLSFAWHSDSMLHSMHFGLRAWQTRRPCQISWWENWIHFSCGIIFIRSCSTFLGSSFRDKFRRFERRSTCVSTTTPLAIPYAVPSTTFAVFRATPGSVSISSIVLGTCPPNSSIIALLAPITDFVFQLAWRGVRERLRIRIFLIKRFGDLVHAHIRALRGKNRGNKQLKCILVLQLARGIPVRFVQVREDCCYALRIRSRRMSWLGSLGRPHEFCCFRFCRSRFLLRRWFFL